MAGREKGRYVGLASPVELEEPARESGYRLVLRRVFGQDVTQCPRCGDRLRVLAFITIPDVTARILDHLGLATAGVPIAPARAPPADDGHELELAFDDV